MYPSPLPAPDGPRSESTESPRIGIVTVAYNSDDVLPDFLASTRQASIHPVAMVVADNAPRLGNARETAAAAGADYLELPDNPGYGAAINAGAALLPPSVDWLLVSNPDVVLGVGSLDTLVAAGDASPSIGAIGPAVLNPDGSVYPSARAVPGIRTGVGHALFANLWRGNPWSRRYHNDGDADVVARDAGWLSGSCVLVRRNLYDELGGFDEGYFMYFEDVDLGYRVGKAGWRNRYEPAASVTHVGAHSTTPESARMIRAHHDSARRFVHRKYSARWLWPVRVLLGAGLRLRSHWGRAPLPPVPPHRVTCQR